MKPALEIHNHRLLFDAYDDMSKAQVLWNLFTVELENAIRHECQVEAELAAARAANNRYDREMKDEMGGMGWGHQPYPPESLKRLEEHLAEASQSVTMAKSMLKFLRDRFLVGYTLPAKGWAFTDDSYPQI